MPPIKEKAKNWADTYKVYRSNRLAETHKRRELRWALRSVVKGCKSSRGAFG